MLGEGVLLEVDRFDPGRLPQGRENVIPTVLIPGDVPIPCQVCSTPNPCDNYDPFSIFFVGGAGPRN